MAYTSFFRDSDALTAITEIVIPDISHHREIKIWDAGCATGEEPYTLAILFASKLGTFMFRNLDILATDHEESRYAQFEDRIRNATYSRKDVFWVPQELRDIYFQATDDPESFQVIQEIREKIRFIRHDLLTCTAPETGQSLIVSKNVLMHFTPDQQLGVLEMYHGALIPGGYLAMDGNQKMPGSFKRRFLRCDPAYPLYRKPVS